tara:strand:+ start:2228 stop:3898 length:1671 start_codon:yes stop_codon:yes gene_type:complete
MSIKKSTTVANYLAKYISKIGVKNIFMLSGTGSIYLDDAFANQRGIKHICARHEAAAVLMAQASAKLNNKIGVVIATTGPGGTNAIGGVVESWVDSIPVLVISGQVRQNQIVNKARSFGIQGFDIISNVKNITKYSVQVSKPNEIRYHLEKAIYFANEGRKGPVWLDIPFDIQNSKIKEDQLKKFFPNKKIKENIKTGTVNKIIKYINKSKKPIIVYGQGIRQSDSIDEFKKLISFLKIPCITARMGLDILSYDEKYFFGLAGMRGHIFAQKIFKETDLIICLGTSFAHSFAGEKFDQFNKFAKILMVNNDKVEMSKPELKVDLKINSDLNYFLKLINKKLNNLSKIDHKAWLETCLKYKKKMKIVSEKMAKNPINSYYFIKSLSDLTKNDTIFVNDAGSANYACSQALELKKGQREITSGAFYSMGLTVPMAVGAGVSNPNKQIIAVTGDGSIELNIQEIRTMAINKLNIKLFVINNGGYASIRKSQDDMTGGRYTDDEEVLNFEKISSAFEIDFFKIDKTEDIKNKLKEILNNERPAMIEVICDPNQKIIETFN